MFMATTHTTRKPIRAFGLVGLATVAVGAALSLGIAPAEPEPTYPIFETKEPLAFSTDAPVEP